MNRRRKHPESSKSSFWQTDVFYCVCIVFAGFLVYSNSFAGVFIFDDKPCIVDNVSLHSFAATLGADHNEIPAGLQRRPVVRWSFALNYALGHLNPWGYHLANLVIHLAGGCLLFGIVRRTLSLPTMSKQLKRDSGALAFAVALIWVVHPLQTESVTYIVQRLESAMGVLYLACIYCILRGSQSGKPVTWYVCAVICCWLGMGSKEVMITAIVVVPLYDRVFLCQSWQELVRQRGWVYLAFVPAVIWLLSSSVSGLFDETLRQPADEHDIHGLQRVDRWSYLFTQPTVILHYLRLSCWPSELCFDYWWPVTKSWLVISVTGAVILGLLVTSLASLYYRPPLGFLGLSFFLVLAPTSSIIPLHLAFEHRMYLPLASVLVILLLAGRGLLYRLQQHGYLVQSTRQRVALLAVLATATAFGALTYQRNKVYLSEVAFWRDVVEKSPHNPRGHSNLAFALYQSKNEQDAIKHWRRTIQLQPKFLKAYNDLGNVLRNQGKLDEAIQCYLKAIDLKQDYFNAHYNLACTYSDNSMFENAKEHAETAVSLNPESYEARAELAFAFWRLDREREAIEHFEQALSMKPENRKLRERIVGWHLDQGRAMRGERNWKRAEHHYARVVKLVPGFAIAHYEFATVLLELDKQDLAIRHLQGAIKLNKNFVQAQKLLRDLNSGTSRY